MRLDRTASLADGINENLGGCAVRETSERGAMALELEHLGLSRTASRQAATLVADDDEVGHDAPPELAGEAAPL